MLIHGYQKDYLMKKLVLLFGFERPFIEYTNAKIKLKFDESILRQKLSTFYWINSNLLYSL